MGLTLTQAGAKNTEATLEAAFGYAADNGVDTLVVASTMGDTGVTAARLGAGRNISVIVVTHNAGFASPGTTELTEGNRAAIIDAGARIHTGTMVLRGLGAALRKRFGGSEEELTASVLRMFGQGMKVCVEMAAMVMDAGLIPPKDIVCVAGTSRGADTAALIHPAASNAFFDIKVRDIIVKPMDF